MTNKLTWLGGVEFRLEQEDGLPPQPPPGQVTVRVRAVGICGTDIHILSGDFALAKAPLILGHEIAGEIVEVGPGVTRVRAGDRVTVDQVIGCGKCFFCQRGSVQYCETGYELGITRDGGCQEFLLVPESNVYKLPDSISFEEGAILDMEVWAALFKCGIQAGDSVLVLGHGPAGMVACQIARAMGARRVLLAGRSRARMQKAKELGLADQYISAQDDLLQVVKSETNGRGADVVVECAGTPQTASAALDAVIPGGKVVFYGVQKDAIEHFALNQIVLKDLVIFGALSDRRGWEQVISLVENGSLRLAPLITHRFSLDCAPAAYELVRTKADGVVKAVLMH